MASNKNEALYKGKRHYDAKGNPLGGIKVEVDGEYMVEIEGGEYKICTDAYHSDKKLEFKNKTNKEVLDYIHNDFSCTFKQGEADSGDFILCRLVVLDPKKHDRKGTVRQILDDMQSEKSCRVSIGKNKMKKGGRIEATPEELEKRWHKKKEHISKMADTIKRLRLNIAKDIKGDDERIRLTALAIAVMDKTAERVGNSDSEQNGHFGITGFKKSHVSIDGNTVRLNYVGKSGVEHEKQFSDELIASELKKAIKYSDCEFVFCTNDGFRVKSDKINRYLSEFGVTAKDIRGYSANRWIIDKLNKIEPNDIGETEAKRKRKFNKVLKFVAGKVGHGASTLRKHYMTPELEEEFVRHGKIIDLSEFYKSGGTVKLSKTPAPLNDRVYGSKKNKPESASSVKSAKEIELSNVVVKLIEKKIHEHNTKHPDKKVNLSAAKAVVRRGMGAYSVTHRPTISGGKPNSRMAWGLARLNAFLYKAVNGHSKSEHYTQDDDLLNELKIKHKSYEAGGSMDKNCIDFIKNTEAILTNGYYHNFGSYCLITYNSGNQKDLNVYQTVNLLLSKSLSELLKIDHESARNLISNYYDNARRFDTLDIIKELKGCNIVIADRHDIVCADSDIRYESGGVIDTPNIQFVNWYHSWRQKGDVQRDMSIHFFTPTIKDTYQGGDVVYLTSFQKINQDTDAKKYLKEILQKADELGVDIYLQPIPLYKYILRNIAKRKKITKEYLVEYYKRFGFVEIPDSDNYMVRKPNGLGSSVIYSEAFKHFFGDWQTDHRNSSKIVDDNGFPLVVYHGSPYQFNVFENKGDDAYGFHFSGNKEYAEQYGAAPPYYLSARRVYKTTEDVINSGGGLSPKQAHEQGFDGWSISYPDGTSDYAVFNASQIKLADGENKTFDPTNPDIRYEAGGNIDREKHNTVGCIIYNPAHGYLILQRGILGEDTDLLWHVLSGGVDEGETLEQTVAREIGEEIGYEGSMDIEYIESKEFDDYDFHYFFVRLTDPIEVQIDSENNDYAWVNDIKEMSDFNLIPLLEEYLSENENHLATYASGGSLEPEHKTTYRKWKELVNMSRSELKKFYDSEEGHDAGLTAKKAHNLGIHYGRESARWIMKMKSTPSQQWTPEMWKWAKRQISFISRMSGGKGELLDDKGNKTRKHLSLLIWGNNPKKLSKGGGLHLYHGSNKEFESFEEDYRGTGEGGNLFGAGYYLTENKDVADFYAKHRVKKEHIIGYERGLFDTHVPIFSKEADELAEKNKVINKFEFNGKILDSENYIIDDKFKDYIIKLWVEHSGFPASNAESIFDFLRNNKDEIQNYRGELEYIIKQLGFADSAIVESIAEYIRGMGYNGVKYPADSGYEGENSHNYVIYNKDMLKKVKEKASGIEKSMGEKLKELLFMLHMQKNISDKLADAPETKAVQYNESALYPNEVSFVAEMYSDLESGVSHNKISAEKIGLKHDIKEKNRVKELTELAICLKGRDIALSKLSDKEKYDELVNLYKTQPNLSHRTSESVEKQQYSTPCYMGYIMDLYCGVGKGDGLFFEPSAGNGMLTIAGNPKDFIVNEIDEQRLKDLRFQNYKEVLSQDGTLHFDGFDKKFDGMITNPPFGSIEPIKYEEFKVSSLEHQMALNALETIKDNGKAAIIIGGNTKWDDLGRIQAGKNREFFVLLNRLYNVEDVVNIDGHAMYSRQGTSYDTRIILINGRRTTPAFPPLLDRGLLANENNSGHTVSKFEDLWERVQSLL